jgi:hypothetical protein
VSLEEMAEPQFEITYLPSKDRSNKKVLALLPEYYSEGLAFSSESVSFNPIVNWVVSYANPSVSCRLQNFTQKFHLF